MVLSQLLFHRYEIEQWQTLDQEQNTSYNNDMVGKKQNSLIKQSQKMVLLKEK